MKDTPPIPLRKREEELFLPLLNEVVFILLILLIITDSMSGVSLVSYFHRHSHRASRHGKFFTIS